MKTMETIYQEMKALYADVTGVAPADGGDIELRLYTAAAQLYSLWEQSEFVLRQSLPQTAVGQYLEYHGAVRGVTRRAAAHAVGTLRFSLEQAAGRDTAIPVGTTCTDAVGAAFETTQAGSIPAGALFCDVPARAVQPGSGGNVPAERVTYMVLAPAGVFSCTNPAAFTDGSDGESDESLRGRVLETYRRLPNGANIAYYETQALNVDGVTAASVMPKHRGVGTVDVVIASETGVPSQTLIAAVQAKLEQQREICVDLKVLAPQTKAVNVTVSVTAAEGFDADAVMQAVSQALTAYFSGALLGQPVLRAKLGSIIYGVKGVENYALTVPSADVTAAADTLPVLGSLRVTKAG